MYEKGSDSRRRTPWTDDENATPLERFIDLCNHDNYQKKHPLVGDTYEPDLLNSYRPDFCRHCGSMEFESKGYLRSGIRQYRCRSCGRSFTIITNTIFDQRKIPITEWIDFLLSIFGHASFNLASKANRNAYNTTRYWIDKLFAQLRSWQDPIMLEGYVYLDEMFYSVREGDKATDGNGNLLRGLSRNKICIGVGSDGRNVVCISEGFGKPSKKTTMDSFSGHIMKGSILIHDGDNSHSMLIEKLGLSSDVHLTKDTKGLKDPENPLAPINRQHKMLRRFLNSHSGFVRADIQDYLNLFSFMSSEPHNVHEKVKILFESALYSSNLVRYRR